MRRQSFDGALVRIDRNDAVAFGLEGAERLVAELVAIAGGADHGDGLRHTQLSPGITAAMAQARGIRAPPWPTADTTGSGGGASACGSPAARRFSTGRSRVPSVGGLPRPIARLLRVGRHGAP